MTKLELYQLAKAADDAYHAALVAAYGREAGDMRYRPAEQPEAIRRLGEAKKRADKVWLNAIQEGNHV